MEFHRAVRRDKAVPLLLAIALVAFALRATPFRFDGMLLGGDPWYHYRIASILLETGEYPFVEYYTRYPFGEPVLSPPGFYYLPVVVYKIVSFTGVSFFSVFKVLPALFGALALLPIYLLVRELFDARIALGAALLYAISPAAMERSFAGFYRGEVFLVFAMLFALYFLVLAARRDLRYSIASGVFLFMGALFWNGWPIALAVLGSAAGLGVLRGYVLGRDAMRYPVSFGVSAALGMALLYGFREGFYRYEPHLRETAYLVAGLKLLAVGVLALVFLSFIGRELRDRVGLRIGLFFGIILMVLGVMYQYLLPVFTESYGRFFETAKGIALKETTTYVWRTGIQEQVKVSLDRLISMYNVLLPLFVVGLIYSVRKKGMPYALALLLPTLPLLLFQSRFVFLTAPGVVILAALSLPLFFERSRRWPAYLLVSLLMVNVVAAANVSSASRPFVSESLYDALTWASENTPEDAVMLAWWDYTGPIVGIADRRTVTHTAPSGIVESYALLLRTSNESVAVELFKSLNEDFSLRDMKADYLIVDTKTYLMWPKILRFDPYVNHQVKVDNRDLYASMLHRFYTAENLSSFELVYANSDVRIYRPLFSYTRVVKVETKRYHRPGESVVIRFRTVAGEQGDAVTSIRVSGPGGVEVFSKNLKGGVVAFAKLNMPGDAPRGRYVALVEIQSGREKHSMRREFFLV
jgi:dolichyl-diphosphooligosaccharide--protein glycosyltransferase